jgi:hypothetical protein
MLIHAAVVVVVIAVKTMPRLVLLLASRSFYLHRYLDNSLLYSQLAMEAHIMSLFKSAKRLSRVAKNNVILYELR